MNASAYAARPAQAWRRRRCAALAAPRSTGRPMRSRRRPGTERGQALTISNWPLYIDVNEKTKKRPTIEQFTKKSGIKVNYIEDVNSNATFFGKIQGARRVGARRVATSS